jgi:pyruvate,water dikinase
MSIRVLESGGLGLVILAAAACLVSSSPAPAEEIFSVEPNYISAGTFYSGATLHIRGRIGERSQVAIRVMGPSEHHTFNRRGKMWGLIWGGVEHVTFHHAPSLYAVYTATALPAVAPAAVRARLRLGYETLEAGMEVVGTQVDKREMLDNFVRLKEREGLYRLAPGAVHLAEAENGERSFEATVPFPATAPQGEIEVAVFELADGVVVADQTARVRLERVGLPAFLFRLAHERGTLFGLLTVFVLLATGVGVDLLGSRKTRRGRHPVVVAVTTLARELSGAFIAARVRVRTPEDVGRIRAKYRLFQNLLTLNNELLQLLAELEEESSWTSFRNPRVRMGIRALFDGTADMVEVLNQLADERYFDLRTVVSSVRADVSGFLARAPEAEDPRLTLQLREVSSKTAGQVGGKAIGLARVEADLGLLVPESFVVTTEAYREFVEDQDLAGRLRTILAPARLDAPDDFDRRCAMAQELVREARVPPAVEAAIHSAYDACNLPPAEGVAVRSSAAGEDGELSFAGQFETVLNVPAAGIVEAWKTVVVSRFAPRAVFYRRAAGLAEVDTPMAVLVQRMVRARASGVLYTRRPEDPKGAALLITAGRGLGPEVSAGTASADELVVLRGSPDRVVERRIARKPARLEAAMGGGLAQVAVAVEEQPRASINDEDAARLARAGLDIERYFGVPQDIEWALDADDRLFILQARPLRTEKAETARDDVPRDAKLLLSGGSPAWPGRAVGPVHVARTAQEEERTPDGALLVVPQLLPDCVRLLPRVCGIVVERGSITGHAASILREFRVPSLFGVTGALDKLVSGEVVSLDAAGRRVLAGEVWPELRGRLPVTLLGRQTVGLPEVLAGRLTKLSGGAFMGTWACQSLHDVIRYAHEVAIQEMFEIGDGLLASPIGGVKRLDCPAPVYLHLVDLGGGLCPSAASKESVAVDEVVSIPFRGLWRGLGDPCFEPRRLEGSGASFGSVLATTMVAAQARELGSPNYACITDSYLNLNSRQAYHFAIVDSFLSANQNSNHVSMRLKGGGAAPWQRNLRAEFVGEVLRRHHLEVRVTGDLVNGWVRGIDVETGIAQLAMIGHLIRFLAQLDMWMTQEAHVREYVGAFEGAEAAALAGGRADARAAAPPAAPV